MIERGLRKLMTERSIHASLCVVNATTTLVREQMARAYSHTDNRTQAEQLVLSSMSQTAEDLEALSMGIINSTLYHRVYPSDAPVYVKMLQARLVPRLVLAVTAALLHGLDPISEPIYAMLIVAFASGTLTKDVVAALLGRLQVGGTHITVDDVLDVRSSGPIPACCQYPVDGH